MGFPNCALMSLLLFLAIGCTPPEPPTVSGNAFPGHAQARPASRIQEPSANDRGVEGQAGRRRSRRGRPLAQSAPGQFDFYLLNLSWSPEFCATHADSPECGRKLGFVVHGLWPQDNDGNYPEDCSNAPGPANPQADTDIIPTVSLVEHEWQTHGTCSGLGADEYFSDIHKVFAAVKIPANIGQGSDAGGVAPDDLLSRFASANPAYPAGAFALSCGNNRLTAVEICLSRDLHPEACEGVRSCRANVVQVTPR